MQSKVFRILILVLTLTAVAVAATRHWKSGTLTSTEQSKVTEGTQHTNSDGTVKNKGNRTDYSQNSTSTSSDNIETYQIYTIDAGHKIIVAREHLLFPWSKSANVNVGEPVKYVVDRGKLILLDDDGKEHKATVVSSTMKPAPE
jgi:hypothetical protein